MFLRRVIDMKIVYMGTPDFAVPALNTLYSAGYEICLCVTKPDKPTGRKQIITKSPVKVFSEEHGIPVYQPDTLRSDEAFERISAEEPDFIVVAAYGKILPKRVLDIPEYGCINIHGSLLPKYRGAAPIQWCVINGEKETGITTMLMNEGLDTGDILLSVKTPIGDEETAGELFDRLAGMTSQLILDTLNGVLNNTVVPRAQNNAEATSVSVLKKEISVIDWNESAAKIHDLVRGMNPWPIANTKLNGKLLKIYTCAVAGAVTGKNIGEVSIINSKIFVCCGDGNSVEIKELQSEGSKRMSSEDFLRGRGISDGDILGK